MTPVVGDGALARPRGPGLGPAANRERRDWQRVLLVLVFVLVLTFASAGPRAARKALPRPPRPLTARGPKPEARGARPETPTHE